MSTIRRMASLAVSAGLILAFGGSALADPSYTYGQFSLMFQRSAGQYDDANGYTSGQWAWSPQSATVADIYWGQPSSWPPSGYEQFELSSDGSWVLMDGYQDGSTWEPQVVTSDAIGDGNCRNMNSLPNIGKEFYAEWNIPASAYCVQASGYIQAGSANVNFTHQQVWSPPAPCSNPYYSNQLCITQTEV